MSGKEEAKIQEISSRILRAAKPEKIILFGSRGLRGGADARSDYDLLVIEKVVKSKFQESIRLRKALLDLDVAIDIIVISSEEFEKRSRVPGTVFYWAKREGRVLHDRRAA